MEFDALARRADGRLDVIRCRRCGKEFRGFGGDDLDTEGGLLYLFRRHRCP